MWGRRWAWLVAWACVAGGLSGCDRQSSGNRARTGFAARPQVLEFGPAAIGSTKTVKLRVANEGRAPLRVEGASSSVPNVEIAPFEPFSLSAGGEAELEVRFSPAVEGTVQGVVDILTDADSDGAAGSQVNFAGQGVKAWVEVRSQELDFGNVALDTVQVLTLRLRNSSRVESPLRLRMAGADADQFSSSTAGPELMLQPGEEQALPIAFKPRRLGVASAEVSVEVCEGCAPIAVPLKGMGIASQLDISPLRVDFGNVALGATAEERIMVRNLGTSPMSYQGARLLEGSGEFRLLSAVVPPGGVLNPGQAAEIRVAFAPSRLGALPEARVEIDVKATGSAAPAPKVALSGEGGSSCVTVLPRALDLGGVAEGMSATREVKVINRCRAPVLVSDLQIDTRQGGFFTLAQAPASTPIAPGQSAAVGVTFTPRAGAGQGEAQLSVSVRSGGTTSTEAVTLKGNGKALPPCQYAVSPATLDFGRVPVGAEVVLGTSVRNTGATECFLAGLQLAAGSDGAFSAPPVTGSLLAPGQKAQLLVRFKPEAEASYGGLAEGWVNHPSNGHPTVNVVGEGVKGCFAVQPTHLEFGLSQLTCAPRTQELIAYNGCAGPLTVQGLQVQQDSAEFQLSEVPTFPVTLEAGGQFRLRATYAPENEGVDAAALRFELGPDSVYTASLLGKGVSKAEQTDTFFQESEAKVDVLFVVDNSGSMMEEQQSLGSNFAAFLSSANAAGVDYHIGVTTTGLDASPGGWSACLGGAEGGENGRLFPVDGASPRVITPTTPNASSVFAHNTQVGVCHWNEQGLEAAYRALSQPLLHNTDDPRTAQAADGNGGFLREDARLALIFLTDEEDFSPQPVAFYETYLRALKNNEASKLSVSAIVGPTNLSTCVTASSSGARYIQLAEATGGVVESICTPNWAESLKKLSSNTFGPNRSFPLSEQPENPSQISVTVDGVPVTSGWHYNPDTRAILFEAQAAPPPGALVEVTYPLGC
ncbi:choice-of-anchor D domain-containing protein [Stigmatella hybrida]|uniref:choice-of-anchor D domain-containing protein n=1 Tax=Stigmatella hybrida TaxID=394097 RepID=UPI001CDB2083|nr:choice-of-anchor D domain-containing protein [Stigmatella hybrida]